MDKEKLALFGGEKAKQTPYGKGMRFGDEEVEHLKEALNQNTLFYWRGNKVKEFTDKFAERHNAEYCVATSSGTAAIHVGLGTVGVTAGDEVITTPLTDTGTIIGILMQNAIPIFADLDPYSFNLDPESVEENISDKTRAILVVHLGGNPTDMDAIMDIADRYDVSVVEDCAQSYLSYHKGQLTGTFGEVGCFSTNDFKHISTGDGGALIMNDEDLYRKAARFADKNYDRLASNPADVRRAEYIVPNYRMTELQGAVGLAQLEKLDMICENRYAFGDGLTEGIKDLPGIYPQKVLEGNQNSYYFYMLRVNEEEAGVKIDQFNKALRAEGVNSRSKSYPCVYTTELFKNKSAYEGTNCPFDCKYYNKEIEYPEGLCPEAEEIVEKTLILGVNEFYTEQDRKEIISAFKKVSDYYSQ